MLRHHWTACLHVYLHVCILPHFLTAWATYAIDYMTQTGTDGCVSSTRRQLEHPLLKTTSLLVDPEKTNTLMCSAGNGAI